MNQVIGGKDSFITVPQKNIASVLGEQFILNTGNIDAKLDG